MMADSSQVERALLGSILLENSLLETTAGLASDDFSLDIHRTIYAKMLQMYDTGEPIDLITLNKHIPDAAYVSGCLDGCVPENSTAYLREIKAGARERRLAKELQFLSVALTGRSPTKFDDIKHHSQRLFELASDSTIDADSWKSAFHSYKELLAVPPVQFAIEGFLQEDGITMIGGLAGHGKTWVMLSMVRSLLEGGKLFHHFPVNRQAARVIYLIPEAGLSPFATRLKKFCLLDHVRDGRLFCQTLSSKRPIALHHPELRAAVSGADLFLDTAVRFMVGEENSATEQKVFAETLFELQRAGARTITGAHHSPKGFDKADTMSLENVLRGSGDVGVMLSTCWGVRQLDVDSNRIFIQNVKPRDFQPCEPFIIQGRPAIDQSGYFELTHPPGFAGTLSDNKPQSGRPKATDDTQLVEARKLREEGLSIRDIAKKLNIPKGRVERML